jgi:predicted GNAT family N-acyltransferase
MCQIALKVVAYAEAETAIQFIRQAVFQVEQGVDPAVDFDGLDATAQHILAYSDLEPIGTARIRYLNEQLAKIERVAVLAAYRGQGVGQQLMAAAINFLDQQNVLESKVHAQIHTIAFYQKFGFQPRGEAFYEANILHIEMRRSHPRLQHFSN